MRQLVYDSSQVQIADTAGNTFTVQSPWLRPRLRGYDPLMLAGSAWDAIEADTAQVLFTVRTGVAVADSLLVFEAFLSVQQTPILGSAMQTPFPAVELDVSSAFQVSGQVAVDLQLRGACRVVLRIIRRGTSVSGATLLVQTQVVSEQLVLSVEDAGAADARRAAELTACMPLTDCAERQLRRERPSTRSPPCTGRPST